MGLIKAAIGAVGGTLGDQWKEAIRCEDMGNDILMMKKTTKSGVISNGSTVIVAPGQLAVIYDNGKIIDATAEEGFYTFDSSSTPSFFAGDFGKVFKEMWQRFTYNGASAKQQAVFFLNIKEILDNRFGTPAPIPYRDWEHAVMNARTGGYTPMRVEIKCFGKYTFQITEPSLFMQKIAGVAEVYKKEELTEQIRSEVIGAFTNVVNSLGNDDMKVGALSLPSKTTVIKDLMDEKVFDEPIRNRGISIIGFVVESVTLDEESSKKIDTYETGGDIYQQKGVLVESYGEAMKNAAANEGGAMGGFMGLGMMNMASGGVVGGAVNSPLTQSMPTGPAVAVPTPTTEAKIKCTNCGNEFSGKFCNECGNSAIKKCPKCDLEVTGKFCSSCGGKVE